MRSADEVIEGEARYLVQTYKRPPILFERGEGVHLIDSEGRRYLDLGAGIAVNALGHGDPEWVAAVAEQAERVTHLSNLYHSRPHVALAEALVENSFADRVFFCNSGAEANEAALKFARRWARQHHGEAKTGFLAFEGGFHGRTIGALALTPREKYQRPFAPLMPGVSFAAFNDLEAAAAAMDETIAAVFVEPIQGEGGVRPADREFLVGLRELCDAHEALLIFDEIQCGLGRTGRLWAHQESSVEPDIMTLAKPLAGGLPIGATLVTEEVGDCLQVGDHGSTFAAGPVVCRAGQVVFERIRQPEFLREVSARGKELEAGLQSLRSPHVVEVRGAGLLWGVEFDRPVESLQQAALERGLIVLSAGDHVLRLAPPLIIAPDTLEAGLQTLAECLPALVEGRDG